MSRYKTAFILFAVLIFFFPPLIWNAEESSGTGLKDPVEFKPLKYRLIGPAWGGRVSRAAGVPGNGNIFYLAGAASGVWKSADGGKVWKSIFDDQPISSIGSLAIAPSDPNVIYVGSGEANIRGNVAAGNGIYKTVDGGKTWTHIWKQEGQIGTMIVHPKDPNIAYAAVLGHAFGPNPERGVYRTEDGGKTWQQVLKKDSDTGASDVVLDPSNPHIVFAGLWQARRTPWSLTSGGPGSGLYVSRDGGDTWKQLTGNGLPEPIWGKVGIAIAPSDSRRVYVLIEANQGGLFRSDDGGENWKRVSANRILRQRAWYYTVLTVNPTNPNEVWVPQVPLLKSVDGGESFHVVKGPHHGDHHDIWIDPYNPKRMIASNDGGVDISLDGGETWYSPALPLCQFYHVTADTRLPFYVAGAIQDIGTAQGPTRTFLDKGIRNGDWYPVGGGEAGHVVSDPSDPNIVYADDYGGYVSLYDHRTQQARHIGANPVSTLGWSSEKMEYRFQWTAPIAVSPHNPKVVYHGANVLFRTDNYGQNWTIISPDLTRNNKSKQKWSGGPITGDNTGAETYCTIFAIAESPVQKDVIWTGSDDGLVQVTKDGGKNWKNVTGKMPGIPEFGTISIIEPSHYDAATAYVVVDGHRLDDMKPYLYKTTNFGDSWERLDKSLPQDIYLHSVREDPVLKDLLYLGTERGVAFSIDGGKNWQGLKLNMPTAAVHDLALKDNSLAVATLGRSIYILDHLSVLREWANLKEKPAAHLFTAPDAIRWRYYAAIDDKWAAENPPPGALFYYWLKEAPKEDITVEILDSKNQVIEKLSSKPRPPLGISDDPKEEEEAAKKEALPKEAGINAAAWNLSYAGGEMIEKAKLAGDVTNGPLVPPGTYMIRLKANGQTYTTPIKVLMDPRVKISEADLKEQTDLALSLRDDVTRLTKIVRQIRSLHEQIQKRNSLLQGKPEAKQLLDDSNALLKKLDEIEQKLHNPKAEVSYDLFSFEGGSRTYSRLAALFNTVSEIDGKPTEGMRKAATRTKEEFRQSEAEWNRVLQSDVKALNDAARKLDVPILFVPG